MTRKRSGGGKVVAVVAVALLTVLLVGGLASLGNRKGENDIPFVEYGSDVVLAKLTKVASLDEGTLTAASYANGIHFAAIDGDGETQLLHRTEVGKDRLRGA